MSSIALTAVIGPAHRNSGLPTHARVFATLTVGGSGMWDFHGTADGDPHLRLRSNADFTDGFLAGTGLMLDAKGAWDAIPDRSDAQGPHGEPTALDLPGQAVAAIAKTAGGPGIGVILTGTDRSPLAAETGDALHALGWSVLVATPDDTDRRRDQWNTQ